MPDLPRTGPPRAERPRRADGPRRQVPLEQRRRELTRVAVDVMARDGAWSLTTRSLAAEAGVPHGAVHYAFSSKDELLRAVLRQDLSHLRELADAQLARPVAGPDDVRAALARLGADYADAVTARPEREAAYFELSLMAMRDAGLAAIAAQTHREYATVVRELLVTLARRAGTHWDADPAVLAEQVLSSLYGASSNWLVHRDDALFRAVLDDAAAAVTARLGPG